MSATCGSFAQNQCENMRFLSQEMVANSTSSNTIPLIHISDHLEHTCTSVHTNTPKQVDIVLYIPRCIHNYLLPASIPLKNDASRPLVLETATPYMYN